MRRRGDDSTVWIGYADFLTTLTVLFFVIAVTFAGKLLSGDGYIRGTVIDEASKGPIGRCAIIVGDTALGFSRENGSFEVRLASIQGIVKVGVAAGCAGYDTVARLYGVAPQDTLSLQLQVKRSRSMTVATLPGDALFGSDSFQLKSEAVVMIEALGRRMKAQLGDRDVIAVQGHTDDVRFAPGSGKDNWVLSAQRAAEAARVLTEDVGIPDCKVLIMGFGPSRPIKAVLSSDPAEVRRAKRRSNRRIEFRQLKGSELQGSCGS